MNSKAKAPIHGLMVVGMKATGKIILEMDKVLKFIPMGNDTKENGRMIKKMAKVL